jgi:hypothetical protein
VRRRQLTTRVSAAVAIQWIVFVSAFGLPGWAAAQDCDRECLGDIMSQFLESLVANDPSIAPLADDVRMTEDTIETPIGEGLWATASGIGAYRTDFLDVREQVAAVHAVMEEQGTQILFAARLQIENREITEIETMVVRGASEAMLFNLDNLQEPSEAFLTPPPADQRMSREAMIEMAMRYPEGLRVGSFVTSGADFSDQAYRFENGQLMAGPGCSFIPGCDDIQNQTLPVLSGITGHVVAVDEENGTVLTRLDFGPGSVMGGGRGGRGGRGGAGGAPAGEAPPPPVLVTFEAFKIYGGEIHAVEAVFESMPANSPTGWE